MREFGRYNDVDGDGIPYRTLPGAHPTLGAYFTRGTSRDRFARYTEEAGPYVDNMERLLRKFETARGLLPRPVLKPAAKRTRVGVLHYGSTAPAMDEAQALLASDGLHVDTLRIRAFPLAPEIAEFVRDHDQVFVVEQNRDAQMRILLTTDLGIAPARLTLDPPFQRDADHRPFHCPGNRQPIAAPGFGANVGARLVTYLGKPKFHHPSIAVNELGFTHRDYEGSMSTLCAGCGHDAISAAIIHACFELSLPPHRIAKLSGIGCSSKTPTYMLGQSHGFNSVHGRMPSVLTGANLANRDLIYLGVSGDGDTASIGLGQFAHAMRRGVNMVYIVENNGVYGLTKGQFSATADRGSKSKKGADALDQPIDLVGMAIGLGASFVARSFSGDKAQLVPLIKARSSTRGRRSSMSFRPASHSTTTSARPRASTTCANTISPSTRSTSSPDGSRSRWTTAEGESQAVTMHDGSTIVLRKLDADHDCRDRSPALATLERARIAGEIATGLIYIDDEANELHEVLGTDRPAAQRALGARIVPGVEGAGGDQRVAEIGPAGDAFRAPAPRPLGAISSSIVRRNVAKSNGFLSVDCARYR